MSTPVPALLGKTAIFEAMADNSAVKALADLATDAKFDRNELTITVAKENIVAACEAVKAAGYNFFEDVTAVDWYPQEPRFQLSYHIVSHSLKQRVRLAVQLNSTDLTLDSITPVWPSANFYVRAEYPLAISRLTVSLREARRRGLLGSNICGTTFAFDIEIRIGAGAFVCGEETALIASIEGLRGQPRPRPPYPAVSGLWGSPTLINNVETFANIAPIIRKGPQWYASIGTERSKGTKVFALTGKITNTGLIEIPMGMTLREIIFEIGGGIPNGHTFKAVQTGGPSGGCLPAEHLDLSVSYDALIGAGSMMGSGGMIVMDDTSCMVNVARFFMEFCMTESCGKCVPCRAGTAQMFDLLTKICAGQATHADLDLLIDLCDVVKNTSLCGLGMTAPNPVLSTLRYFKNEYLEHIDNKHCRAGVCACSSKLATGEEVTA